MALLHISKILTLLQHSKASWAVDCLWNIVFGYQEQTCASWIGLTIWWTSQAFHLSVAMDLALQFCVACVKCFLSFSLHLPNFCAVCLLWFCWFVCLFFTEWHCWYQHPSSFASLMRLYIEIYLLLFISDGRIHRFCSCFQSWPFCDWSPGVCCIFLLWWKIWSLCHDRTLRHKWSFGRWGAYKVILMAGVNQHLDLEFSNSRMIYAEEVAALL